MNVLKWRMNLSINKFSQGNMIMIKTITMMITMMITMVRIMMRIILMMLNNLQKNLIRLMMTNITNN